MTEVTLDWSECVQLNVVFESPELVMETAV